jgi:hypothetical protein
VIQVFLGSYVIGEAGPDTIFFNQVFDDLLLALIHPTGNRDDEKRKWIPCYADCKADDVLLIWKLMEMTGIPVAVTS